MSDAQPIRRREGITFGRRPAAEEFSGAQVIEDNFPKHRTLHLKPDDGTPQTGERIEIVVTEEVLLATAHHVAQDTSKESGGFLLGNRYECPNTRMQYIVVDQFMKADYTEGTQVSLTFTTESWGKLKDRMDGKYRGKQLVGWYHSHPGMGIFLSNYDLDIHKNRFANEWDVALVLDPIKHEGGFFAWIDGNVNPHEKVDFYELLDGDSRETVVAWTNYTAEDPKTKAAAALKAVNTQNSDGNPLTAVSASQKAQPVAASGGALGNPFLILVGAGIFTVLLLGGLFAVWWLFFSGSGDTAKDNSNTLTSDKNKVLIAKNIRIGDKLEGWVSSDNKMTVDLEIKGIGSPDVIEQVRKDMIIEINGQPTTLNSEVINGSSLKVRAVTVLDSEVAEGFRANKEQDFKMRVEMSYGEDVVAKSVNTKFQKGKGNDTPSLGSLVAFGDVEEENVAPVKKKPVTTDNQNEPQKRDNDNDRQQQTQTQTQTQRNNPRTQTNPTAKPTQKKGTTVDDNPVAVPSPLKSPVNQIRRNIPTTRPTVVNDK